MLNMLQARCPYLNLPINDDKYQLISFQSFQTSRHVCFAVDTKIGKVCFLSTKIWFLNTDYCICLVCVWWLFGDLFPACSWLLCLSPDIFPHDLDPAAGPFNTSNLTSQHQQTCTRCVKMSLRYNIQTCCVNLRLGHLSAKASPMGGLLTVVSVAILGK